MAFMNRGNEYYEADREVIRTGSGAPYDSCNLGYVAPIYPNRHHHGVSAIVSEVVTEAIPAGGYGYGPHRHHHHGRPVEYIERDERVVENVSCDPYRRPMY